MVSRATLVVGAGIVGLACAVEAQRRGRAVTIIESGDPGHACSIGNAGIIAASEIFPLVSFARMRELPRMIVSRRSPATIRITALAQFVPWMARAVCSLRQSRQDAIVAALTQLNRRAVSTWRDLLMACSEARLLRERGMIRLIRREDDWDKLTQIEVALKSRSLPAQLLRRGALAELEPAISASVIGGLLHESDADIGDPLHVSRALLARFIADGGALRRETAIALRPSVDGAEVITESGRLAASQVFVTAGLQSGALLRPLGVVAPLQAERGYHLMLTGWGDLLTRPVTFQSESCVATPMGADLRLAGTVEFAREVDTPDWSRAECLESYARRYFDSDLVRPSSSRWIGSRPSLPDSLPAIGRVRGAPAIGYAFGHQHLGVTQAAISARLLCEIMDGATPSLDCGPYDVARFGKS